MRGLVNGGKFPVYASHSEYTSTVDGTYEGEKYHNSACLLLEACYNLADTVGTVATADLSWWNKDAAGNVDYKFPDIKDLVPHVDAQPHQTLW